MQLHQRKCNPILLKLQVIKQKKHPKEAKKQFGMKFILLLRLRNTIFACK